MALGEGDGRDVPAEGAGPTDPAVDTLPAVAETMHTLASARTPDPASEGAATDPDESARSAAKHAPPAGPPPPSGFLAALFQTCLEDLEITTRHARALRGVRDVARMPLEHALDVSPL